MGERARGRSRNRNRGAVVALLLVLASAAGVGVGGGAASAQVAAPTLTLTPSTDLVEGDEVAVTGTGFLASTDIYLVICPVGVVDGWQCDWGGGLPPSTRSDSSGSISTTFFIRRHITIAGALLDCAETPCWILAGDANHQRIAQATLHFADGSTRPPTLTVGPADASGLVTVEGAGFLPRTNGPLEQCAPGGSPGSGCLFQEMVFVDAAGRFSFSTVVDRDVLAVDGRGPVAVDCAPSACTLRVRVGTGSNLAEASAPLDLSALDPSPISVTGEPSGRVADGTEVTVAGSGFGAQRLITVRTCAATTDLFEHCPLEQIHATDTDDTGAFALVVPVRRDALVSDGAGYRAVDCAVEACALVVEGAVAPGITRRVTLPLDVAGGPHPPLAPVLTAEPVPGSPGEMTIHGEGFPLGGRYWLTVCAEAAPTCVDLPGGPIYAQPDGTGAFTLTAEVDDRPGDLDVSCVVVACVLEAQLPGSVTVARSNVLDVSQVPLTVTVADTGTLDAGTGEAVVRATVACAEPTAVSVRGIVRQPSVEGGFTVEGEPCAPDHPALVFIPTRSYDVRDAPVSLGPAEVEVLAVAADRFVEDAASSTTASVELLDHEAVIAALVPALLDPANVALREEVLRSIMVRARQDRVFGWELLTGGGDPAVTATPTTGLVDGQVMAVSGTGFLPGVPVGVAICPAGVLDARRCSASNPWSTTADSRGRFTLSVAAVRIVSADGFATSVDCAVEACVLALGDPGAGRVARVPLAFDPTG